MTNLTNNSVPLSNAPFQTPKNIELKTLRTHCVSVRLNKIELRMLNTLRGHYAKGEWLRMSFLQNLPPVVPTINTEAWKKLSY